MSSSIISTLESATKDVSIYFGIPMLIFGVIGGVLNVIIFLSLKIFRRNSCAFYLTVMSFVNVGILLTGLLSRITISGFTLDWTQTSSFYCKCRVYLNQLSMLTSLTCICLATIHQFRATNSPVPIHHIKFACHLVTIFVFIWILHGIPYLFYYNLIISPKTRVATCSVTNITFQKYTIYGFLLMLSGILPYFITILFGLLAYRNVRQIKYRAFPLIRRELDKQMTAMVLIHVIFGFFTLLPYIIVSIIDLGMPLTPDPIVTAFMQFMKILTIYFYYFYFVCPFYIYICVSKRFRQQLIYVFSKIHSRHGVQQNPVFINQISPQTA